MYLFICVLVCLFFVCSMARGENRVASGGLRAGARDSAFSGAGGQVVATVRNAKAHGHSTLVPCTSLHSPLNALFGI